MLDRCAAFVGTVGDLWRIHRGGFMCYCDLECRRDISRARPSAGGSLLNMHGHVASGVVILAVQGVGSVVQFVWMKINPYISLRNQVFVGMSALAGGTSLTAVGAISVTPWIAVPGAFVSGVGFGLAFMVGTRIVNNCAPSRRLGEVLAEYFVVAYFAISVPSIGVGLLIMEVGAGADFAVFTFIEVFSLGLGAVGFLEVDEGQGGSGDGGDGCGVERDVA